MPVGLESVAAAPLFQHHGAFGLDLFLAEDEAGHPLGLVPHHHLQPIGGDDLEVSGVILASKSILATAIAGDQLGKRPRLHLLRPLEHQMFEVVGNAGLAGRLIGGTDLVPDHVGDHGGARIADHDHLHAVLKRERLRVEDFGGGVYRGGWSEQRATDERCKECGEDWERTGSTSSAMQHGSPSCCSSGVPADAGPETRQ